ncbi:MAG: hypothetical protein P1U56_08780 [Saprospiraceae bacterium]|nr:hypothetical protein [Saprospiraceae bacterium]
MKRRLFLKNSSVGLGGILAMPTVLYGCSTIKPILLDSPSKSIGLFQEGSRMFDSSIVELRLAGSGELAAAEAEDADLSGIAEQVANKTAAIPAEVAEDFAESSIQLLDAAKQLNDNSSELFPLNAGTQAELADDFILLKVVKASTLLASAAMATPDPFQKVTAAENMIRSSKLAYKGMAEGSQAELMRGTSNLLAHSEEYVGSAEKYSAELGFIDGVETFEGAIDVFKSAEAETAENPAEATAELTNGVSELLTSTDNLALSSEYYVNGVNNLNAERYHFRHKGAEPIMNAEELFPYAEILVETTPQFYNAAQGEAAKAGAAEMMDGAESIEFFAETNGQVINLGLGGETLDIGADRFISGSITDFAAGDYDANSMLYLLAAEDFQDTNNPQGEAEYVEQLSETLYPESENFYYGALSLQSIGFPEGVQSVKNATDYLLAGAQMLLSEADNPLSAEGAEEMVKGAAEALKGAEEADDNPTTENFHLELGAETIEFGTNMIQEGAAKFVDGYFK